MQKKVLNKNDTHSVMNEHNTNTFCAILTNA